MCLMTHRPLKKINRSPDVLIFGFTIFVFICFVFYNRLKLNDYTPIIQPKMSDNLYLFSEILLVFIIPMYITTILIEPGILKQRFDLIILTD